MRARLAIASAGVKTELREVVLRNKPAAFLDKSPSGTVPCLVTDKTVIDESLDVMIWALENSDPEGWLEMPAAGHDWISENDGPFKRALDRTKYETRYPDCDPAEQRALASEFLDRLNDQIGEWIFDRPTLADYAIAPFVRQFASIDKDWFNAQPWPHLQAWLERFMTSERFAAIMTKYPAWTPDTSEPVQFP